MQIAKSALGHAPHGLFILLFVLYMAHHVGGHQSWLRAWPRSWRMLEVILLAIADRKQNEGEEDAKIWGEIQTQNIWTKPVE